MNARSPTSEDGGSPSRPEAGHRDAWRVWGPLAALALVGFALTWTFLEPPPPHRFSLAAGSPGGAYHAFAERYRDVLAREGYELEIVETAGSVENFDLLRRGDVDLALLQGGVAENADAGGTESIASVFLEALWIVHRADFPAEDLRDLAKGRLAVGTPGSGTRRLALQVLADNGLDPVDLSLLEIGTRESREALTSGRADAAFFVSSASAAWIGPLLADPALRILEIPRRQAYVVRHRFLTPVTLGRGVVDLETDLPDHDVPLLGAATALAARRDLPVSLVPLLVTTLEEVHGPGGILEEPQLFPSQRWLDLPLMKEARHYLERGPSFLFRLLPFWAAATLDRLKILLLPALTLLLPVFKAAPPLYRWRIRSKIFRWYEDLRTVDDAFVDQLDAAALRQRIATLERIEREVIGEVSVPLSYMDELYRLREHIHLVQQQLEEQVEERIERTTF